MRYTPRGGNCSARSRRLCSLPRVRSSVVGVWRTTIVNRTTDKKGINHADIAFHFCCGTCHDMGGARRRTRLEQSRCRDGENRCRAGGGIHRYGFPRSDLHVTLDGVTIKPALALGGWVAFAPMDGQAMAMGDLVLLESE